MDRRTSAPPPRCQSPTFQHESRAGLYRETASSDIHSPSLALLAHGGVPPFLGLASRVPSRVCTLLTSRSMTALSAPCQARSSVSSSDCSRNSCPGTVRIWDWRVGEPGGGKARVSEESPNERPRVALSLGTRGRHSRAERSGGWTAGARWPGPPRAGPRYFPAGSQPAPGNYERN